MTMEELLRDVIDYIALPESIQEFASERYAALAEFLDSEANGRQEPAIYPQGSFRLGTVIKPIREDSHYDLDLVYRRELQKASITQAQLKSEAGAHLLNYLASLSDEKPTLEMKRRCWTLTYEDRNFHMDVLPAVQAEDPDSDEILIADRDLREWQPSNPIGFATWFKKRMSRVFESRRVAVASLVKANIEDVEDWRVKTPLQQVVQLLKRHRDIYFDNLEYSPPSIMLTTLAALAYENEDDILTALVSISNGMPRFLIRSSSGCVSLPNPVHSEEDFADRLNEEPGDLRLLRRWFDQVRSDVDELCRCRDEQTANALLNRCFMYLPPAHRARDNAALIKSAAVPPLGREEHALPPRWPIVPRGYRASVVAEIHARQYGTRKLRALYQDRAVGKNMWLRFRVHSDVPEPYKIKWQVTNTGSEAAAAAQLRGCFYDSDNGAKEGRTYHWERTAYAGTHWVEAFIIKSNFGEDEVVARSGRFHVRIRP